MLLKEYPPGLATRHLVQAYRVVHFDLRATSAVKVYPPTPENCLQLFVRERERVEYPDGRSIERRSALTGGHDVTVRRLVPPNFLMIQVVFEPGALHRLTGVPSQELRNGYYEAEDFLGPSVIRLTESLRDGGSYAEMLAKVDAFLTREAARRTPQRDLLRPLRHLRDVHGLPVERVASDCGLSLRQFERLCRERTGFGPKAFARIARFDRAFHAKIQRPERDWMSIAVEHGYYDYQHMAREFRAVAGATPPQLLATQRDAPEALLGLRHEFDLSYGPLSVAAAPARLVDSAQGIEARKGRADEERR